jgi:type I restriction enzyme S subunit
MKAAHLLAMYERIADAPDAVARLRRFVLDLAVRGKLEPQDAGDEPASELLKRIRRKHALLQRGGRRIRSGASSVNSMQLERSAGTPRGWEVVSLAELVTVLNGRAYRQHELLTAGTPVLRVGNLFTSDKWYYSDLALDEDKYIERGDLIYAWSASFGPFTWQGDRVIYHYHIWKLALHSEDDLDKTYLHNVLLQQTREIKAAGHGISMVHMTKEKMERLAIPLPPLAEQRRIVAKVDELMALCDRLEAARTEREAKRDRLAAASLARLNTPDPETFPADASFALNTLPALTTRPDQIKALRQTILNLAVRGKLVPQDPNDEPALELLKRLARAKAELIRKGELRREKPLPPISSTERAFDLPPSWVWVRLGDLSRMVTSGSRDWAQHYADEGAIFLRMGNLSKGGYHLRLNHIQRVKAPIDAEGSRTRLEGGDILISITGDVGMLGLIPDGFGEAYINQHTAMVRPMPEMKGRYLAELFRAPFAQEQFNAPQRGIKNSFRLTDVTEFLAPLPPLAEQRRIIAKVDELMALCDALEASLGAASTSRTRLLNALLADALSPIATGLMAAAQ